MGSNLWGAADLALRQASEMWGQVWRPGCRRASFSSVVDMPGVGGLPAQRVCFQHEMPCGSFSCTASGIATERRAAYGNAQKRVPCELVHGLRLMAIFQVRQERRSRHVRRVAKGGVLIALVMMICRFPIADVQYS